MVGIKRPLRRFYTSSWPNIRYRWWWAQQGDLSIPGAGIWLDSYLWNDSDVWRD